MYARVHPADPCMHEEMSALARLLMGVELGAGQLTGRKRGVAGSAPNPS